MNKSEHNSKFDDTSISKQADYWAAQLSSQTCTDADYDDFLEWISEPTHVAAYEKAKCLHDEMQALRDFPDMVKLREKIVSDPAIIDDTQTDSAHQGEVVALNATNPANSKRDSHQRSKNKKVPIMGFSVGFSVAASLLLFALLPYFQGVHTTDIGEIRSIVLEDGSNVTLDTDSSIRTDFDETKRIVHLRSGRAYFDVAKNENRPFTVVSGDNTVTAIGTAFSVNSTNNDFIVRLNEGIVDITSDTVPAEYNTQTIRLVEGQQWYAQANAQGEMQQLNNTQLSWLKGSLTFESQPLSHVVEQINRYSKTKIIITYPGLLDDKIDAVFYIGKTDSFASALEKMLDLSLSYSSNGDIILSR